MDGNGLPARCLRASRPRNSHAEPKLTSFCTPEQFLPFSFEASRRPGGERSGPGRRIPFFCNCCPSTAHFCSPLSSESKGAVPPDASAEAASAPRQVARYLRRRRGSLAVPVPPLCSRARATPRPTVPILHSTAQHHGRHAVRRLAERRHQKGRGLRKRCAALRANHDLRPRPASYAIDATRHFHCRRPARAGDAT